VYPVDEGVKARPVSAEEVLMVDVGGGKGQALQTLKEQFPGVEGRLVLQDPPLVIESVEIDKLAFGATVQDFFMPQPVVGTPFLLYFHFFILVKVDVLLRIYLLVLLKLRGGLTRSNFHRKVPGSITFAVSCMAGPTSPAPQPSNIPTKPASPATRPYSSMNLFSQPRALDDSKASTISI